MKSEQLKAIIIELNGSSMRYDIPEQKIHEELQFYGFKPFSYDPFSRLLQPLSTYGPFNTIYLRNERWAKERISNARHFSIFGFSI